MGGRANIFALSYRIRLTQQYRIRYITSIATAGAEMEQQQDTLNRAAFKQAPRRFTGDPITAMGALDGLLSAISTSHTTVRSIAETAYIELLQRHDWHFDRSDDGRVYRAGQAQLSELMLLQRELDVDGSIWNAHSPADCQLRVPS